MQQEIPAGSTTSLVLLDADFVPIWSVSAMPEVQKQQDRTVSDIVLPIAEDVEMSSDEQDCKMRCRDVMMTNTAVGYENRVPELLRLEGAQPPQVSELAPGAIEDAVESGLDEDDKLFQEIA